MQNLWKKISLYIKRFFYLKGFKNFDYFFEKYKNRFEEVNATYTIADIKECAEREHNKVFRKHIMVSIFIGLLVFSIGGLEISTGVFSGIISAILSIFAMFSKDAWLGFLGDAFGSVIAIVGIYVTIRFERKQREKEHKERIKPIILINTKQNEEESDKNTYNIVLSEYGKLKKEKQSIDYPEFVIRNFGHIGMNLSISVILNGVIYSPNKLMNYIPSNDYVLIKAKLDIPLDRIRDIFKIDKAASQMREYKGQKDAIILMYYDVEGNMYKESYESTIIIEDDFGNSPIEVDIKN